jgi:hypothetical protein
MLKGLKGLKGVKNAKSTKRSNRSKRAKGLVCVYRKVKPDKLKFLWTYAYLST